MALNGDRLSIIIEGVTNTKKGAKKNPINMSRGWTAQNKIPVINIIKAMMFTKKTPIILEYASRIELT